MAISVKKIVSESSETYPKLMSHQLSGLIILMIDDRRGFVIDPGESSVELGHFSGSWQHLQDFHGTVELKNAY